MVACTKAGGGRSEPPVATEQGAGQFVEDSETWRSRFTLRLLAKVVRVRYELPLPGGLQMKTLTDVPNDVPP